MKKRTKIICIGVPLVLIVLWLLLSLIVGATVKAAVEAVLPKITGTPVKLDRVGLSLFSGKASLSGIVIGNPEGFQTESAFELGTVRVDIDLSSLFSDKIVIEEIYIDAAKVTYEAAIPDSNIAVLQKNVEEFAGPKREGTEPEEEKEKAGPGRKVQLDRFVFENGEIALSATVLRGRTKSVTLPRIELTDIGTGPDGATVAEVAREVFTRLGGDITRIATAELERVGERMIEAGTEALDEAVEEGTKDILDTGKKGVEDALKDFLR